MHPLAGLFYVGVGEVYQMSRLDVLGDRFCRNKHQVIDVALNRILSISLKITV